MAFHAGGQRSSRSRRSASWKGSSIRARFVRIHRSYLLNIERLARVELYAKDSRVAILTDGTKLPVSRAGLSALTGVVVKGTHKGERREGVRWAEIA